MTCLEMDRRQFVAIGVAAPAATLLGQSAVACDAAAVVAGAAAVTVGVTVMAIGAGMGGSGNPVAPVVVLAGAGIAAEGVAVVKAAAPQCVIDPVQLSTK